jgi:hypothetical protein
VDAGVRSQIALPRIELRSTVDDCHPMVAKTARYFAGVQAALDRAEKARERAIARGEAKYAWFDAPYSAFGRYSPNVGGTLRVVATTRHIDWILRFHDALLRSLIANGCRVHAKSERDSRWVELERDGETVRLSFAEEFDKVPIDNSKGHSSMASERDAWYGRDHTYKARDSFKLKMESEFGSLKQWVGTAVDLETQLATIARDILLRLATQPARREIVEAGGRAQRIVDERRASQRLAELDAWEALANQLASRRAQLARASETARARDEYLRTMQVLDALAH